MRRGTLSVLILASVAALSAVALPSSARSGAPEELAGLMSRIGERIEQYYARAQSIISEETVRLEPLGIDLLPDGSHVRKLVFELRVAWEAATDGTRAPEATVLRQLISVDGRPPRPGDEPGCLDPKSASTEPLAMLLSGRQREFAFTWRDAGRTGGHSSVTLDYKSVHPQPPNVTWKGQCVSIELPGRTRGRVWVDGTTADVLRLDEGLIGSVEIRVPRAQTGFGSPVAMIVERADSSIRYHAVTFHDPEEIVMLPESIESLQVVRNSGAPRLRIVQTFANYKRFMTGGRIVQ
jgi:hypothetical protein